MGGVVEGPTIGKECVGPEQLSERLAGCLSCSLSGMQVAVDSSAAPYCPLYPLPYSRLPLLPYHSPCCAPGVPRAGEAAAEIGPPRTLR